MRSDFWSVQKQTNKNNLVTKTQTVLTGISDLQNWAVKYLLDTYSARNCGKQSIFSSY